MDKTEAAGRKQTERALNKLSTSLSRHGATISVAFYRRSRSTLTAATISQSALAAAPTPFPPPPVPQIHRSHDLRKDQNRRRRDGRSTIAAQWNSNQE